MFSQGMLMFRKFFSRALPALILCVVLAAPAAARHSHLTQAPPKAGNASMASSQQHTVPSYCAPANNNPVDMPAGGWTAVSPGENPKCPNGTQPYLIYSPHHTNASPAGSTRKTGAGH